MTSVALYHLVLFDVALSQGSFEHPAASGVALFGRQEKSETMAKTQTPFSVAFLLVYLDLRSYVRRYAAMQPPDPEIFLKT